MLAHRKTPGRLPIVLSIEQIEALIAAARDPLERAVPEVLYATGVRVSELINLKIGNIDFAEHSMLVKKGKGGKDRYVVFGRHAMKAMQEYSTGAHMKPAICSKHRLGGARSRRDGNGLGWATTTAVIPKLES